MKKARLIMLVVVLALSLVMVGSVSAQETETETTIEGTVIAVDEEAGTVDILQSDGTPVTITLSEGDYDHPITALLAEYFGTDNLAEWSEALAALETDGGSIVSIEETTDADDNTIWVATLDDGSTVEITDAAEAEAIMGALEATAVSLEVETGDDGGYVLPDISEEIEAYHEMGLGYGELVKIYAIAAESQAACEAEEEAAEGTDGATEEPAATEEPGGEVTEEPCGVTVEELAEMLLSGTDMGTLFELYGKPALLGVGHVRQALGGEAGEGGKVAVCHNDHTIVVDQSAVASHTSHGDTVGGCP